MNWLKGLVAPAAQYVGQAVQQQGGQPGMMPPQDPNAPPMGGAPNQYGFQQQPMQQPMQQQQPPMQQPMGMQGNLPDASQWSTGTRTQGSAQQGGGGISGGGSTGGSISGGTAAAGGGKSLDARCAELEHDVASLALFARTLLTMLEDQKVVTREQFMETKNKLDMLDGKIDDR
jgi:hypothetical protein